MKQRIPFVGQAYQAKSLNADAQRSVNCYIELDQNSNRAPIVLYGTPGSVLAFTLPKGPVRACAYAKGFSWWLSGDTVYRVDQNFTILKIGSINSSTGVPGIASNGTQVLIVDGIDGWIIDASAATLTQITDADFPNGVKRASYQDGYFIVTGLDNSPSFWINQSPYDGVNWDALDFASAEGSPDDTIGCISDHRELWLFGSLSAEVWINTGSADFPFQRSGNTFIEHGCASSATIAKADNTVFWLGNDDKGSGIVWRADGYTPVRISTHAIENAFSGYTLSNSFAFTYQDGGHVFYVLTFPTDLKTWVYDCANQTWHERSYTDPSTGKLTRWRPNCMLYAFNKHLCGDFENGNVYYLDANTFTDNGAPITRIRAAATQEQLQDRLYYEVLQIDMETGVGTESGQGSSPTMMLRYSNDGGHSWSNTKFASVGNIGQYGARCLFKRLGAGRNRVWEISMTDPVKFAILGAVADMEAGL